MRAEKIKALLVIRVASPMAEMVWKYADQIKAILVIRVAMMNMHAMKMKVTSEMAVGKSISISISIQ